jgi:hypothetical protein
VIDRFEREETWPTGREIDQLVNAYAELTDVTAAELWKRALEKAEQSATLAGAEQDLLDATEFQRLSGRAAAAERAGEPSKQKPASKGKRRRAG